MTSLTTRRFWAAYRELPTEVRDAARKAYALFRENPQHPSLRFKKVHERAWRDGSERAVRYGGAALSAEPSSRSR